MSYNGTIPWTLSQGQDTIAPHFEAHTSYLIGIAEESCSYVMQVRAGQRCRFVQKTKPCHDIMVIIDYMELIMCHQEMPIWLGAVGLCIGIAMLAVFVVVNAEFFAPDMALLAEWLRMSEGLAGATFLPFINASGSGLVWATVTSMDATMQSSTMLGTTLCMFSVCGGTVLTLRPLYMPLVQVLWHCAFLSACVVFQWSLVIGEVISVPEVCFAAAALFMYTGGSIGWHLWNVWRRRQRHASGIELPVAQLDTAVQQPVTAATQKGVLYLPLKRSKYVGWQNKMSPEERATDEAETSLWRDFARFVRMTMRLRPALGGRWYFVVSFVPKMFHIMLFPVSNQTMPHRGWCKLGVIINMFGLPPLFLIGIEVFDPLYYYIGLVGSALMAVTVYLTSHVNARPIYHNLLIGTGAVTSSMFASGLTREMAAMLGTLCRIAGFPDNTAGASVLALSYSLCVFAASAYIVLNGFPVMAMVSSFASPTFVILLTAMMSFHRTLTHPADLHINIVRTSDIGINALCYMLLLLALYVVFVLLAQLQQRRSLGVFMLLLYVVFFVNVLGVEMGEMHAFGTSHYDVLPYEI